jgi:hypothetical protein
MGMEEQERLMGETSLSPQPSPTRGEGEKIEGPQTWSKGNPYAKKANAARETYNRLIAPTEHEKAMAEAFPETPNW